jgi:mevalonate kinase
LSRIYPAKLLLFGEYSVLSESQALAVPVDAWSGYWSDSHANTHGSPVDFFNWLKNNAIVDEVVQSHMIEDFEKGWTFESTIPVGHGVGSSGAYVAAVYDRYLLERKEQREASKIMASMESYFHGSSSGMDPLVCLENKAVLKDDAGTFHIIHNPGWPENYKVYLWDSGIERTTAPLVNLYKNKIAGDDFRIALERNLIPMVDHAIHFYLNRSAEMLEECISVISQFQRNFFTEMIPPPVMEAWENIMRKERVYMKLCGAGGGGFFMIISASGEEIKLPGSIRVN